MFINTDFTYDGILSSDMNVHIISTKSGMVEMPFGYSREIIEESVPFRSQPYFFGFQRKCMTLEIELGKIGENEKDTEWTYEEKKKLVEWFWQKDYKPFISLDNPELIYYCTPVGDSTRFDNGYAHGYVKLQLRCNSPHAYSPTYVKSYDYQVGVLNIIEITNPSNVNEYYYPEVQFKMMNSTSITIRNLTTGEEFTFTGLNIGENIYVDNSLKQIETDMLDTYRLSNFNKKWLRLVKGVNRLEIIGKVNVVFRSSYPISI
ncbi:phage tail domain-containing protein [Clostridium tagluense]|uniref:Phage tail protein n=1 Tax=Clostridium tagluense TaxID=360422 RepID=A0A401UQG1_9CLOT|nr:phage tail domain-containing protein [Clostridium tagluense]GCD11792.1 hypothetical protein Ctaglu_34150 [Clostridium tagluense]